MYVYLALALLLLVVMAWFILQPFLAPSGAPAAAAPARATSRPPVVTPPKTVARAATVATAATVASAPQAPAATAPSRSAEDVRASVEAAIAARKAAMVRHSCDGCGAPVDAGDAFCRACGTRVEEG
jgi:hypothetical protein